jgi:hypothetical protein
MQCPICAAPADHLAEDEEGLTVTCRHCGKFQVSDEALNALLRLDLPHRNQALQDGKRAVPPGERPHITTIAGPTRRGLSRFSAPRLSPGASPDRGHGTFALLRSIGLSPFTVTAMKRTSLPQRPRRLRDYFSGSPAWRNPPKKCSASSGSLKAFLLPCTD